MAANPAMPLYSTDLRLAKASTYIESQSLRKIQTRLQSSDYFETTVSISERKRFENRTVLHPAIVCRLDVPFALEIEKESFGSEFTFTVEQKDTTSHLLTDYFQFTVIAELNETERLSLFENAESLLDPSSMQPARFYRNNSPEDEKRLMEENDGYYPMKRKDRSGHRGSPLFGVLNGVYMSCRLKENGNGKQQDDGQPKGFIYPTGSHYGTNRRSFNTDDILNVNSRIFLADFYCFKKMSDPEWFSRPHYPLLVVCQQGSSSYHECVAMKLKELDWETNCFLRWKDGELLHATRLLMVKPEEQRYAHSVWPEIFVCDTSVLIMNGHQHEKCDQMPPSVEVRSFYGCNSCHRSV